MTTLFCTGNLFSNWKQLLSNSNSAAPSNIALHDKLTEFSTDVCQRQFPGADEVTWKPFTPEETHLNSARDLLSSIQTESTFVFCDTNSSLYLDLWKKADESAKFLLFYSSPESELAAYFNAHPYDAPRAEQVIEAWINRTMAMLKFFMNNREASLLVNLQSAIGMRDSLGQNLKRLFGIDLEAICSTNPRLTEDSVLLTYLATGLLAHDARVAELYDETRSAATTLCEQDKSLQDIQSRSENLVPLFLKEAKNLMESKQRKNEMEIELSEKQHQIFRAQEELDDYYVNTQRQTGVLTNYLSSDPLLRIARQLRLNQ